MCGLGALLLCGAAGSGARASAHSESWARERFAAAERMREALNGRPPAERTRHDYQRVLNAYRNVYYGAPTSTKADPSAVAVAETLVEMGRRFEDDKILNEAIAQYKFLRQGISRQQISLRRAVHHWRNLQRRSEQSRAGARRI